MNTKILLIIIIAIACAAVQVLFQMPVILMFLVNVAFMLPIAYLISEYKKEKKKE
jgi:Flp pilus assembly protein TadB